MELAGAGQTRLPSPRTRPRCLFTYTSSLGPLGPLGPGPSASKRTGCGASRLSAAECGSEEGREMSIWHLGEQDSPEQQNKVKSSHKQNNNSPSHYKLHVGDSCLRAESTFWLVSCVCQLQCHCIKYHNTSKCSTGLTGPNATTLTTLKSCYLVVMTTTQKTLGRQHHYWTQLQILSLRF